MHGSLQDVKRVAGRSQCGHECSAHTLSIRQGLPSNLNRNCSGRVLKQDEKRAVSCQLSAVSIQPQDDMVNSLDLCLALMTHVGPVFKAGTGCPLIQDPGLTAWL